LSRTFTRQSIHAQIAAVAVTGARLAGIRRFVGSSSEWGTAGNLHQQGRQSISEVCGEDVVLRVASVYKEHTETASGEKFDPPQLMADHRILDPACA